jgi:hypothetical protein
MTDPAGLGVNGKGRAAKWRLTEWECDGKSATRDFPKWDGKVSGKPGHPVRKTRTKRNGKVSGKPGQRARPENPDITIG